MTDTPIREVIARAIYTPLPGEAVYDEGDGLSYDVPWDDASPAVKASYTNAADAVRDALAALTDADVDAAIERLGEAAFEYGKKISDYLEVFPNGFRSEAFEDAERDLRANIAMRGRGVVVTESTVNEQVEKEWQERWKELVSTNGVVDLGLIKNELSDYGNIMDEVSKAYDALSGGMISKPNTHAIHVIQANERMWDERFNDYLAEEKEIWEAGGIVEEAINE